MKQTTTQAQAKLELISPVFYTNTLPTVPLPKKVCYFIEKKTIQIQFSSVQSLSHVQLFATP